MHIPGKKIAEAFEKILKRDVLLLKKKKITLKLVTFLIGTSADQLSFVAIKKKTAERIGVNFEFVHLKKAPNFQPFIRHIKERSDDPTTTAIIVQQPLPGGISSESIYDFVATPKEIEGHKRKSPFEAPLGLATLTLLKYAYGHKKLDKNLFVNLLSDRSFFKQIMKNKRVVLVGRGQTGGQKIGKVLSAAGINFINVNSQTPNPQEYYKAADVIITATGKRVIRASDLKPGVVLINAGVRRESGRLKGDYDESEVKKIASYYTPTPGGIGPVDVIYLYKNLVDAARLQHKIK